MCDTCEEHNPPKQPTILMGLTISAEAEVIKAETPEGNDE